MASPKTISSGYKGGGSSGTKGASNMGKMAQEVAIDQFINSKGNKPYGQAPASGPSDNAAMPGHRNQKRGGMPGFPGGKGRSKSNF